VDRYDVVVLAASAGGILALGEILAGLPADFPLPLVIVQHRTAKQPSLLRDILQRRTALAVKEITPGTTPAPGTVYVAPPDLHAVFHPDHTFGLVNGHRIRHVLSSANPLFAIAASAFDGRLLAVVPTGYDSDGTDGVQAVKALGGTVIAQDRATSESFAMPATAIRSGAVDLVLPLPDIAPALVRLAEADGLQRPAEQGQ
jgi:two-component system chemotaxis response regulator CheB